MAEEEEEEEGVHGSIYTQKTNIQPSQWHKAKKTEMQ